MLCHQYGVSARVSQTSFHGKTSGGITKCQDFPLAKVAQITELTGQIRGKIGQFRRIFVGKKSKFAERLANFAGFSREKSQNSQENRPISRDFSGKKSIFEGFSGANS